MKVFFLFILTLASFNYLQAQENNESIPVLYVENPSFDFGDIKQDDKVEHIFKIKNKGTVPLVISNVITTCGCTATEWSKNPIAPNDSTSINIAFDSRGKMGIQNKVITIISNSKTPQNRIKIKANILPKN